MTKDTPIMADPRAIEADDAPAWIAKRLMDFAVNPYMTPAAIHWAAKAATALLAAQPQETPEQKAGEWHWVPVEPIEEMYRASKGKCDAYGTNPATGRACLTYETVKELWQTMLAAAPEKRRGHFRLPHKGMCVCIALGLLASSSPAEGPAASGDGAVLGAPILSTASMEDVGRKHACYRARTRTSANRCRVQTGEGRGGDD